MNLEPGDERIRRKCEVGKRREKIFLSVCKISMWRIVWKYITGLTPFDISSGKSVLSKKDKVL